MRRALLPVLVVLAWVAAPGIASAHAPAPTPSAKAVPGKKVCDIADQRLVELSGIVTTADGYVVINDSPELQQRDRIFFLNRKCGVRAAVPYAGAGSRDPEDIALSRDGKTVWIGDIGDNNKDRQTIALWKMPASGSGTPTLFRLKYPDGAKDAEALLIGGDGLPIIITKTAKVGLYRPGGPLKKNGTVTLKKAGELTLPRTSTSNPFGPLGRITVTGAGSSPDGARVVLRSYADAFEWSVPDGDIVKALTGGPPRVTPLPDEPLGEAITYSADGASFLTVSETSQADDLTPKILRYTPAKDTAKPATAGQGGSGNDDKSWFSSWFADLSLSDITYLIGGVGVLGVVLVVLGVMGIMRARRRAAAAGGRLDDDPDRPASGSAAVPAGVGAREAFTPSRYDGPRAGGAVYGGGGYRNEPPYEPERTGNVYGGGQYRGAEPYARPDDDRPAPPDRYGGPPRGYEGFTGNGYAGDGYAGRYPPGEPEYRSPSGGFYER